MNNLLLLYSVILPVIGALICLLIPNRVRFIKEASALIFSIAALVTVIMIFGHKLVLHYELGVLTKVLGISLDLRADALNSFILIFISLFGFLIALFSLKFMQGKPRLNEYYAYLLLNVGAANGAMLSDNLLMMLIFWDVVLLCLFGMISIGGSKAASGSGKKAFIIVGAADFLMLLGILLVWKMTGSFSIDVIEKTAFTAVNFRTGVFAFILMACGALAKAGSMPFHTWIPDAAEEAPVTVMAFLPAALDKLLGIYLLIRITYGLFGNLPLLGMLLMSVGAFTIIAAVMMALVQHDMKKLLSYHAVSQVGYMVLGIGTGNPIGIAGGLFHMMNHTIYKSCLFMGSGAVEKNTGTTDLEKLGGLAKTMPITFVSMLIAAFSISGVPPFNGFVSKWMVYQGIVTSASVYKGAGNFFCWLFLIAALFGSALTLASFMKLIHAVFLGQPSIELANSPEGIPSGQTSKPVKEVHWSMWAPMAILAALCVFFGVAAQVPLMQFIGPAIPEIGPNFAWAPNKISLLGLWSPTLATGLMLAGLALGWLLYAAGKAGKVRIDQAYIGGEKVNDSVNRFPGTAFYNTVSDIKVLSTVYSFAEKRSLDFYEWGVWVTKLAAYAFSYCVDRFAAWLAEAAAWLARFFSWLLRYLHIGFLPTYLTWYLIGFGVILYILIM